MISQMIRADFKWLNVLDRSVKNLGMSLLGHHFRVHSSNLPVRAQDEIFKSPKSSWVSFFIHSHHFAHFKSVGDHSLCLCAIELPELE